MILVPHQPCYLPWLGFFAKLAAADTYCILDNVQYQTHDFNNRNRIKTQAGPLWLTVPVESRNHFGTRLCDARVIPGRWQRKHVLSIRDAYYSAPFFEPLFSELAPIISDPRLRFLTDLNLDVMRVMMRHLGIGVNVVRASDYDVSSTKSQLILDLCKKIGAGECLFGALGQTYADAAAFAREGIAVRFQKYAHPVYNQQFEGFVPNLSAIDLAFNEGPRSLSILMRGQEWVA